MRTQAEIEADFKALMKDVQSVINEKAGDGFPHLMLYAVLDSRHDLKERFDKLNKEASELESK